MDTNHDVRVIRAPSLKRGKNEGGLSERIKLKRVLGLTVCSNAALDVSPTTGVLAYPAGCTVVLFNSKKLSQSYLLNTSRKAITAIAYSRCGRYIATGECGQNPAIKVWDIETTNGTYIDTTTGATTAGGIGTVVAEFLGHKYAVSCIAFSPTGKYLVSVGSQHDMIVNVFDWKSNLKIASNKVSAKVVGVCFSEDGNYFVTVGNRHVKYWYLEGSRKYKEPIPLMGRSAILGELRNNDFCAVACGKGDMGDSTYAITRNGHLVEFNSRRLLDKWVACRTTSANCLCISRAYILVGCAESIIRVFNAETLEYLTTLPRTHYLGVDVAQGTHIQHITTSPPNAKYPDTIAMVYDEARSRVSCVYNDHSLYIWDLRDIRRVGKSHSFLYHSACIWGVETVPYNFLMKASQSTNGQPYVPLPSDCFLTCSSDDTIRVWGMDGCDNTEQFRRNIYSKELLKVVYIDDDLNFIKDMDNPILNMEKSSSYDGRNGVRCMKISPECNHLATGDRSGNIRIYSIGNLKMITSIEAHDSEVLCLEYTNEKIERRMLASASRDRLIHVFDVDMDYQILQTLDDHSSSITSVKFIGAGLNFQMISCGADKSIIFRTFQANQFMRGNNCSGKTTLYDMEVDSNFKHILTACQDRNIRIYGTQNAKHTKTFKGSHSDEGSLIKLSLDLSGIYIATSCTDKTLSVYDYYSTECMAKMYGHSELVTGLKFTNDCRHLISASGDGCIFIWQVPHDMIVTMQARLSQQALRSGQPPPIQRPLSIPNDATEQSLPNTTSFSPDDQLSPTSPGYRLSDVGQLPQWAKKKIPIVVDDQQPPALNSLSSSPSQTFGGSQSTKPRGRWAQKATIEQADTLDIRSVVERSPVTPPFLIPGPANHQTSDYNSASSKEVYGNSTYLSEDSSIDSGMENRKDLLFKKMPQKSANRLQFESNTEHDGDVEDISDGERTSSDHGLFYPSEAPGTPTDFKVNAMDQEELRKSVRRTKVERKGLTLVQTLSQQSAPSTGTGTGTSDDDDEGSTPSGDNAERSLASTLGGSSESIHQTSSSFLQAALDGPGSFSDRGEKTRRSLSAKHNTDSKNNSYTKSFSNTKKEELMKVINEAKQKLENDQKYRSNDQRKMTPIDEVGYRSNLRASQSISDLSHSANVEASLRSNRNQRLTVQSNNPNIQPTQSHNQYFNCATPKSILTQNCQFMRQLQRDYPPYPCNMGVYNQSSVAVTKRPTTLDLTDRSPSANKLLTPTQQKYPGILKHYKSCPVSPVHEELDWSQVGQDESLRDQSTSFDVIEPMKRHSIYSDDAQTILDMIHSDTEKMIAEITEKYGDLDDYNPKMAVQSEQITEKKPVDDDVEFSSDSLEDCSVDIDPPENRRKTICHKHSKKSLPKRSVSDYFIYEEFYTLPTTRNISLSDILNEAPTDNAFLDTQRHSSASFFLGPEKKSQESLLSDDVSGNGHTAAGSYCNSMESILSDDSECKSAPLEVLFGRKRDRLPNSSTMFNMTDHGRNHQSEMTTSKSYGSSPNATNFDYYMHTEPIETINCYDVSNYTFEILNDQIGAQKTPDEFIPSLGSKNMQYNSGVNKSLSKEFANHRQTNNSNPIIASELFERKTIGKPAVPAKPFKRIDVFAGESIVKKSCSFEIDMLDNRRLLSRSLPNNRGQKYERNLEKFENDRKPICTTPLGMDYVPHKPPVANRRSGSMKTKRSTRDKDRYHTVGQINCTKTIDRNTDRSDEITTKQTGDEKTFEMFVHETSGTDDDNMDSLELYSKPKDVKENSMDSLDDLDNVDSGRNEKTRPSIDFLTTAEYRKFRDIEHKIDVVNKLVEMEEKKLEQERRLKARRMEPFQCNSQEKGYVKSLTMNFDQLAKRMADDRQSICDMPSRIRRNFSLPDVLEGAKMKVFTDFMDEDRRCGDDCDECDDRGNPKSFMSSQFDDSIRRACSLSDLSMGKGYKSTNSPSAYKQPPSSARSPAAPNRTPQKRTTLSGSTKSLNVTGMGTRSVSVGQLNHHSDSDHEINGGGSRGGIHRPTISSQNKINGGPTPPARQYNSTKNAAGLINRRRCLTNAYSSVNLSSVGQEDSSSEEAQSIPANNGKPAVPPRPRSISIDHKRNSAMMAAATSGGSGMKLKFDDKELDVTNTESITSQMCSNIICQLMNTTNSVMQLHQRLKFSEDDSVTGNRNKNLMLKELESAVNMTQTMLTTITSNRNGEQSNDSVASTTRSNQRSITMNGGDYGQMLDKCSDILSTVQKHVNNT